MYKKWSHIFWLTVLRQYNGTQKDVIGLDFIVFFAPQFMKHVKWQWSLKIARGQTFVCSVVLSYDSKMEPKKPF